jgi:glycine/D-amino acid oxidase-like deaminating enzyme
MDMAVADARTIPGESPPMARSLWAATAADPVAAPALSGTAETEVAVVGGGFTGLSTALHLAERGVPVHLLEAHAPGWGASGRNGGQVIAGLKHDPDEVVARFGADVGERAVRLAGGAAGLVFDLIDRHGIACDARRDGWIQGGHDAAAHAAQRARVAQWTRRDPEAQALLSREEMRERTGCDAYVGGLIDRRSGGLHPLNYALGLARAAISAGAAISGDSPVTGLDRDGAGWRLTTPGGTLKAKTVILATNGYSGPVEERVRRSLIPACSAQVATAPLGENVRRSILPGGEVVSDTRRLLLYFRITPDGRFVIGGRGAYTDRGVEDRQEQLRRAAVGMFPQLEEAEWEMRWGGYVAITADHLPRINRLADGLYAGFGYNGRGVAMATAMGRVLADKAAGAEDAALDFPVTPTRPIPLHALRRLYVSAMSTYYAARDRIG